MDMQKIVNIANNLINEEVSALINMLSERLFVFVSIKDGYGICLDFKEGNSSCINGARVQLNMEDLEKEVIKNAIR